MRKNIFENHLQSVFNSIQLTANCVPVLFLYRPGYKKVVPEEGMPISSNPTEKGDLIIEFDIVFPTALTPQGKNLIKAALQH